MMRCPLARAVAVLPIVLSGGCATLTINVDVYKGPLANADSVRDEQLAAMAVATRPILVDLRYAAETSFCRNQAKIKSLTSTQSGIEKQYQNCMASSPLGNKAPIDVRASASKPLLSSYAQKINAVLSLYYDMEDLRTPDGDLKSVVGQFRQAVEGMRNANRQVTATITAKPMGRLFDEEVAEGNVRQILCEVGGDASAQTRYKFAAPLYKEFAQRESERWSSSAVAGIAFPAGEAARGNAEICEPEKGLLAAFKSGTEGKGRHFSRYVYELMRGLEDGTCRKESQSERQRLMCAIQAAVQQNQNAFRLGAEILGDVDGRKRLGPENVGVVSRAIAELMSPRAIRLAGARIQDPQSPMVAFYRKVFSGLRPDIGLGTLDYPFYRSLIALELQKEESGPALALSLQSFSESMREAYSDEYGLLTYPLPDPTAGSTQSDDIARQLEKLSTQLDLGLLGLDRGRPNRGLDSYVKEFMDAGTRSQDDAYTDGGLSPFKRALIHFSQKLVFLADNDALLDGDPQIEGRDQYVRVLQALGNSILSNLDELVHKSEFEKSSKPLRADIGRVAQHVQNIPSPRRTKDFLDDLEKSTVDPATKSALKNAAETTTTALDLLETAINAQLNTRNANVLSAVDALAADEKLQSCLKADDFKPAVADTESAIAETDARKAMTAGINGCKGLESANFDKFLASCVLGSLPIGKHVEVARQAIKKTVGDDRKKLADEQLQQAELVRLQARVPGLPPALPFDPPAVSSVSAYNAQVWDDLDTALKYLHVVHVAKFGDSPYTQRIRDAQELVGRYRSGAVYLRPATYFLRNSYPAAAIQPGSGEDGKNLLFPSMLRKNPENLDLQRKIDKQFWQSVNRVVVHGGGDVNYAVTKDDIGNWYVKGYSADSRKIAQSMKKVALFAAGPATRATLATKVAKPASEAGKAAEEGAPAESASAKQLKGFSDAYTKDSEQIFRGLQKDAANHRTALLAALKRVHSGTGKGVTDVLAASNGFKEWIAQDESRKALLDTDPDPKKSAKTAGDFNAWTIALLEALHDYTRGRANALRDLAPENFGPQAGATATDAETQKREQQINRDEQALFDADEQVREKVLDKRERSIDHQRRTMDILAGQVAQ